MSAVLRRTFEGVSIVTDEDPERWSELHAAGNRIEALAPWLASFSRLRVLDLRHNMIESCAGVAACVQLITIDVRDNRLSDGAALVRDLRPLALLQQCVGRRAHDLELEHASATARADGADGVAWRDAARARAPLTA